MFPRPAPAARPRGDYAWSSVSSLLAFEGADAATTTTDEGSAALTWTFVNQAQIDTAQATFGASSCLFDGTGDVLTSPNDTSWDFGSGDFTVEGWVRYSTVAAPGSRWVPKWTSAGNLESWKIGYVHSGTLLRFSYTTNGSTDVNVDGTFAPVAGTWYHFAVARGGNLLQTFINGAIIGTKDVTGVTFATVSTLQRIGAGDTGSDHAGWLDNIRVTKGKCRYQTTFTPPTETFPNAALSLQTGDSGEIPVYVIVPTTEVKWVDYIPVKDGLTTVDGNVPVEELEAITGLTAWVDYVPVSEDAGAAAGQNRCEANGWIPVSGMNP